MSESKMLRHFCSKQFFDRRHSACGVVGLAKDEAGPETSQLRPPIADGFDRVGV